MIETQRIDGRVIALRLCRGADASDVRPAFQASGLVVFVPGDPPGQAWGWLFTGEWQRRDLRELLRALLDLGITKLVAYRMGRHTLPFATIGPDGEHIVDVAALAARAQKKSST